MAKPYRAFPPLAGGDARWVASNPAGAILRAGFFEAAEEEGGGGGSIPTPLVFGSYQWVAGVGGPTYTCTGLAIGPADSERWVIAAVFSNFQWAGTVSGVTIGGVAATSLYGAPVLGGGGGHWEFWKAKVPTGTIADVVVTTSDAAFWDGAGATYYCIGEPSFVDGAQDGTYTGNTFSVAVDVVEGGAIIAIASNDNAGVLSGWVGASADSTDNTEQVYYASEDELAAETGRTVSFTTTSASGSTNFYGLGVVSLALPLTGGGAEEAIGTASGTLPLGGSGQGVAPAAGVGAGTLPLGGSGAGQSPAAGQGAGSLPLSGSGTGKAEAKGQGAGSLPLGGSGQGQSPASGQGAGSLPLSGSATGVAPAVGAAAGELPLGGSGTGITGNSAFGTGAGVLPLGGSGTGEAAAKGQGAGSLPLGGSGQGLSPTAGQGAGGLPLAGSGSGKAEAKGQGAGVLPLGGSGQGKSPAAGQGAGALPLGGAGQGAAPAAGSGSGTLPIGGSGSGVVGGLSDYTTGFLAFASAYPRAGTFLTDVRRKGRVLNPTRRGKIMEIE